MMTRFGFPNFDIIRETSKYDTRTGDFPER